MIQIVVPRCELLVLRRIDKIVLSLRLPVHNEGKQCGTATVAAVRVLWPRRAYVSLSGTGPTWEWAQVGKTEEETGVIGNEGNRALFVGVQQCVVLLVELGRRLPFRALGR